MFLRHDFDKAVDHIVSIKDLIKRTPMEEKQQRVHFSLPKADMHVHISLALTPNVFVRRVYKRRTPLSLKFLIQRKKRYYPNLSHFHATYEKCRHMTKTQQELANTVQAYLEGIAREGAIYAEISNSFREGAEFEAQMEAVEAGIRAAKHNTGIESRIVVTTLRNHGPGKAEEAAKQLIKLQKKFELITGFGLVGDEGVNRFSEFSNALHIAWHEAGLGLTPHVAEQQLHNAVDFLTSVPEESLNVKYDDHRRLRVGHGVLIHMSDALMEKFSEHQICMELCPSANKRIGLPKETLRHKIGETITSTDGRLSTSINRRAFSYYKNIEQHPIEMLMDAGIPICLGSDNPLLMNTNIGKEHSMAHIAGITDMQAQLNFTRNAVLNANVDHATRSELLSHVDGYTFEQHSNVTALGYMRPQF